MDDSRLFAPGEAVQWEVRHAGYRTESGDQTSFGDAAGRQWNFARVRLEKD
jgi:hypothetical protein